MSEQNLKTVIMGASPNPTRYAYMAAERLQAHDVPFELVSIKKGELFDRSFHNLRERPVIDSVHTITLYIGASNLDEWNDYILSLNPKRIIFNPGTENMDLANAAKSNGIETVFGCTLVMLGTGQY